MGPPGRSVEAHYTRADLGEAILVGEPLGLDEQNNGQWTVTFGPLELGAIDHKGRFHEPRLWT